ncbi:Putative ribonuclease H protein At1g65750 [Linum perenne]
MFFADDLILFGWATPNQAGVINGVLEEFCGISGQEVSREKSRLYFSKNTKRDISQSICSTLEIPATQDLGRYLGVPIVHGRNSKELYQYLLERLDQKLSGWKSKSLSAAGRASLAQLVLNSVPSYVMQTTLLPAGTCEQIDRRVRDFIWGSSRGDRKIHLLNWKSVCRPKSDGGLGIRSAREMNSAFLMKLCWGMMKCPDELWARVLHTKYFTRTRTGLVPRKTKRFSSCWRGIQSVWPIFRGGLAWGVRNGRTTNFWKERWIDSDIIIADHAIPEPGFENMVVADFCSQDGVWDVAKLSNSLPQDLLEAVIGMTPPSDCTGNDVPIWGLEANGQYSVHSGYLLACDLENEADQLWRDIWNWEGPQRIRHFMWLASQSKLLTNVERRRRNLSSSDECGGCNVASETLLNIVRDCPVAKEVWSELLGVTGAHEFFHFDVDNWWRKYVSDKSWALLFGITTWTLWKTRNERIFEGKAAMKDSIVARCRFWSRLSSSTYEAAKSIRMSGLNQQRVIQVGWCAAEQPFFTLNSDGSVRGRHGIATAGGCIRDNTGRILDAFTCNLRRCSITRAELTGAVVGLERAWELGAQAVEIQMDSSCAISILNGQLNLEHQHAGLVLRLRRLLERRWRVRIIHIFREGNHLADHIANRGHDLNFGIHTMRLDDATIQQWARYDLMGCSETRRVRSA